MVGWLFVGLTNPRLTCAMKMLVRGSWWSGNQADLLGPHRLSWMRSRLDSVIAFIGVHDHGCVQCYLCQVGHR